MLYAINDKLLARLRAFITSCAREESNDRAVLLQELAIIETDPILSSLLWTKRDLVAEFRALIHGTDPRNPDASFFDKTVAFVDPLRERLANEMAGNVDDFCLGIRNDVDTDITVAALDTLRNAVLEELDIMGVDSYGAHIPSASLIADRFAHLSQTLISEGLHVCVRHVAHSIHVVHLTEQKDAPEVETAN